MAGRDGLAVFEALRPDLLRLARALLRGSRVRAGADDLVQTVLTRILAAVDAGSLRLDTIQSPRHFAYAALRNLFFDEVKAWRTQREEQTGSIERVAPPAPADAAAPSLLIRQVLAVFDPPERCFILRVLVEERSVGEAQKLCGWPPRSPYYHLQLLLERAREALS
jgi:DNA-directed RNA polymerase specialized sigma24 family protein